MFVSQLGLTDAVTTADDVTAFLFTDAKYAELPAALRENLASSSNFGGHIARLIFTHFVAPSISSAEIFNGQRTMLSTVAESLVIDQENKTLNGFNVTIADIKATNGNVHFVDGVLVPPSMLLGVFDYIQLNANYSILAELIELEGFGSILNSFPSITLMAPPNPAWDPAFVDFLRNDQNARQTLVLNHLVTDNIYEFEDGRIIDTEASLTHFLYNSSGTFFANMAALSNELIYTMNGMIAKVDRVFSPPTVAEFVTNLGVYSPLYGTDILSGALNSTGILKTVTEGANFTLFAPVDAAFEAARLDKFLGPGWTKHLEFLLQNHIAPGRVATTDIQANSEVCMTGSLCFPTGSSGNNILIGTGAIVLANLFASNGIMHGISRVLVPPALSTSIYTQLEDDPNFSMLLNLIDMAGLKPVLTNTTGGPITLFCPTNAAFAGINTTSLSTDQIATILLHHAVGSNIFTTNLSTGNITTLSGEDFVVVVSETIGVSINGEANVNVDKANNLAGNGVFHPISNVLIPPALQASPAPTPLPTFSDAMLTPAPTPSTSAGTSYTTTGTSFWSTTLWSVVVPTVVTTLMMMMMCLETGRPW